MGEIDPAWVPVQALVLGYGEERSKTLEDVFCQSNARRLLLFSALAKWAREYLDNDLVRSMAAAPGLDEEVLDELTKAIASIYARAAARNESAPGIWDTSGDEWFKLMKEDMQSNHSGTTAIGCSN